MVTLTEKDLMELLQKNNLREDALEKEVVERLAALHLKTATAESCTENSDRRKLHRRLDQRAHYARQRLQRGL